jgi:cytochrome P450
VARQPRIFLNAPRLLAMTKDHSVLGGELLYHNLLNMDPPEHAKYRDLISRSFTPRAVRSLLHEVEETANDLTSELSESHGSGGPAIEYDFVREVAAKVPLDVIAALLGVPKADRMKLMHWTNEVIGSADPEFARVRHREKRCNEPAPVYLLTSTISLRNGVKIQRTTSPVCSRPHGWTGSRCGFRDVVLFSPYGLGGERDDP